MPERTVQCKRTKDGIQDDIEPERMSVKCAENRLVDIMSSKGGNMAVVNGAGGHSQHNNAGDKNKEPAKQGIFHVI